MLEIAEENRAPGKKRLFIGARVSALWITDSFISQNNAHATNPLVTSPGTAPRQTPVATQQPLQEVNTEILLFDSRLSRHNLYTFSYLIPSHTYPEQIHFLLSRVVRWLFLRQLLADARTFSVCVPQGSTLSRFFFSAVS